MITILDQTHDDLVAISVSEKITSEDYDMLLPFLEEKIEKHGSLRMYFEIQNLNGVEPKAAWKDLKFELKHVALNGDF